MAAKTLTFIAAAEIHRESHGGINARRVLTPHLQSPHRRTEARAAPRTRSRRPRRKILNFLFRRPPRCRRCSGVVASYGDADFLKVLGGRGACVGAVGFEGLL
jgi:hypothetical protein